ncbi:MAG: histidine kinase [Candidatus Dormibacteria bacterium]
MDETNVLIFTFSDPSKAYQALSEIKAQPRVEGAAVVERTANGEVRIAEGYTPKLGAGPAVGGLIGALVGIIAGPLGMLLGWSTGIFAGAAYESFEAVDADDGFTELSKRIPASGNALLVEMTETSHAVADDIADRLQGTVTRVPSREVEIEVAAARDAARKAAKEARRVRRETHTAAFKEKVGGVLHHTTA